MTSVSRDPETLLPPEELLRQLEATLLQEAPTSEATEGFHSRALALLDAHEPKQSERVIEYAPLVAEHAERIAQGQTSSEISAWLSEKLGFTWAKSDHHGEFRACSTPQGDLTGLKAFLAELGVSWSPAHIASDNHPEFYLGQEDMFNALFGEKNMQRADEINNLARLDWEAMGNDSVAKEKYLKDRIGLDIKGNWKKLTGVRNPVGGFVYGEELCASGTPGKAIGLDQADADFDLKHSDYARICFLG